MGWLFLVLLIFFETVADVFAKQFAITNKAYIAITSILFFVIGNVFWLFSLKFGVALSKGASIFAISTAIACLLLGVFVYKEEINFVQVIGIALGMVSIYLIIR